MRSGLRDEIRRALQDKITNPATPVEFLVQIALTGMDAHTRLENATSRNMQTDVDNLALEMRKCYFVTEGAARMVMESVAELLGYVPPAGCAQCDAPLMPDAIHDIGGLVPFGDYMWRVLDVQGERALLLCEHILEQRAYHPCYEGVTWETSKLRAYLNGDFLHRFDPVEQSRILETTLANPDNLWYGISGGRDTTDRVFILSTEEADRYFGDSGDYGALRRKKYDNGAWVADASGWIMSNAHDPSRVAGHNGLATFWWLRTPGYSEYTIAYVSTTGNIPINGDRVCIGRGGVRPAMWVKNKGALTCTKK
ncbi:MAG: DUF6273 domain-containing protein [Defluviitaleaceae bacterium]|nr:DUF6273 domain-containing protein [Defluviitaleaceae bacterium]MCL2240397.1 DUF6273 domain-containing protein [Defluviitaleaceae bacterium]